MHYMCFYVFIATWVVTGCSFERLVLCAHKFMFRHPFTYDVSYAQSGANLRTSTLVYAKIDLKVYATSVVSLLSIIFT